MTISDLIPTLQPTVETISTQLRFICFFVLVAAMIVRTGTGNTDITHLLRPLTTNAIICAFLATLPFWFNTARDSFWAIAVQIQQDFTGSITETGTKLMQQLQPPDGQINWLDVTGSLWRAFQWAVAWIIVWLGAIIQGPMMFFQFIMACLCYMFLPIAVSLFAFDGTKGIATRYVQQTLAILAWPIGFATVDLVGNALFNSVATAVAAGGAVAVGTATEWGPASFLIAGFIAVWLILGSLATPVVMQALFCSGSPTSSVVGHAIQYGLGAAGLARFAGGGDPPAPSSDSKGSDGGSSSNTASSSPSGGGGGGSSSAPAYTPTSPLPPLIGPVQRAALTAPTTQPALTEPPPQATLPSPASGAFAALADSPTLPPSPASAAALPPRGHTQPRSTSMTIDMVSDPSGTLYAASVMEQNQIPTAIAY
jgi:uncharacterized membrane protein YgcG